MAFTIVSQRQGVTSSDSSPTPHEALVLASALVRSGVEKVWVYDEAGQFVSASELSKIAGQQGAAHRAPASTTDGGTIDLLASDDASLPTSPAESPTGPPVSEAKLAPLKSGRVFRIAIPRA